MKKISATIFTLLLIGFCFTGCKKDKEERTNYFQVGDKVYDITHGDLEYYGTSDVNYDVGLNLLTAGITLDENGYWENAGTGIWFEFISSANDGLPTGKYIFDEADPAFSIYDWEYCTEWTVNYATNVWFNVVSGTVDIKRTGNNYVINITGKDEDDNIVKGNFSGTFELYDFSSAKGRESSHK